MEPAAQQSNVESVVHRLAKPATKGLAWSSVAVGAAALALATWRNIQGG
ncbi:MAG TPA: hypothetical protein VG405_07515 [Solirubrobacteraceae bacterium]|jgi:hypothetical protein|nr:hypothetical protein [Solirubrobacteraceae bacterium]